MRWFNLYERFPGALPSELMREDFGLLTRPFVAGAISRLMREVQAGKTASMSESERKLVEPLIRPTRKRAKKQNVKTTRKK